MERLVKSLARRGREREGAQVVALHQKLVSIFLGGVPVTFLGVSLFLYQMF